MTTVEIPIGPAVVRGDLEIPPHARGLILFAHGSGSSRQSPRNQVVAQELNEAGFATLLMDLLTEDEARYRPNVFDIHLLANRLNKAMEWLENHPATARLPLGLFGASTGAAAALAAASYVPRHVKAIVSRGGRPDMAHEFLSSVSAPTLLIVGEEDVDVLELNRFALEHLNSEKKLEVVPGATHLFEEEGAMEWVVLLAKKWFLMHVPEAIRREAQSPVFE